MSPLVSLALSYLILYKYYALFVTVFLAGFIVPIPINIVLMALGAFSASSDFSFKLVLIIATFANFSGDMLAYFVFSKVGSMALHEKYSNKYSFFVKLENYFKKHQYLIIFFSRIIGVFGTPVNFLSGFTKVPILTFAFFDILGNFVFVSIFLSIGYFVGDQWVEVSDILNNIIALFSLFIILRILFFIYKKNYRKSS